MLGDGQAQGQVTLAPAGCAAVEQEVRLALVGLRLWPWQRHPQPRVGGDDLVHLGLFVRAQGLVDRLDLLDRQALH